MRLAIPALAVLSGLAALASPALACGDKFLIVGRCVSYQRTHMADHPGHVLILWSSSSKAGDAIRDVELQEFLQEAGHRIHVMELSGSTREAIASSRYDVVLADAADAERLRSDLAGTGTRVLPVLYQATNAEVEQVRQTYRCALNFKRPPLKRTQVLVALDDAMKRK